ncbi:MAG: TOBE domain-containing protein [Marinobacter sp.]|nr:TOBE domain-containing protein [Marinobacter sp.]
MSDRVVVLKDGYIQQLGTPREVYERPANLFTARFVGQTNFFPGQVTSIGDREISVDVFGLKRVLSKPSFRVTINQSLHVLLRPEDIRVLAPDDSEGVAGEIVERNYKGSTLDSVIELEDGSQVMASEFF